MKKICVSVIFIVILLYLIGCSHTSDDLFEKYPEYYNLDTFKGIEVYVWQTENSDYLCGAMSGTNRDKSIEEISALTMNGVSIKGMKTILASYDIDKEEISIIPITITSTGYEVLTDDFTQINEVFWKT